MYKGDKLRKYIDETILIKINKDFRIRLSKEMVKKYECGSYTNTINNFKKYIRQIKKLNLQYPANAKPVFYIYLVPDDNFIELLKFPYINSKQGGRPVPCYDIDGFNHAYGSSQNSWENAPIETGVSLEVNLIHELAHLVHGIYFNRNRFLSEGFAEALPLYTMDYESKFDKHLEILKELKPNQVFSIKELLKMEKDDSFNGELIVPNGSCAFRLGYISSYLFVRGCLETIASKFNISRVEATQKFLEIVRSSECTHEWLVYDIADALELSRDELLNKKTLQNDTLRKIIE